MIASDSNDSNEVAVDIQTLALECLDLVVMTASGEYTNQENNNYREIAIFKSGVTL